MIELVQTIVDVIGNQPLLVLSGLQMACNLLVIMVLLPRRWQAMVGLAALGLLILLFSGRLP